MGLFALGCLLAAFPAEVSGPVLYHMHRGQTERALSTYLDHSKKVDAVDHALLQEAGMRLLEQGAASDDPEIVVMSLFGAGVAASPQLLPILEKGIFSKDQKCQLVALNFLGKLQDDDADALVARALSSPFLLTRLEASLLLAQKRHPQVMEHIDGLYGKVPPPARPLFAQIAAPLDTPQAALFLRRMLSDTALEVRIEAIVESARSGRDDLLSLIRSQATHPDPRVQEAAAFALGRLKDSRSIATLKTLSQSRHEPLRLTALSSLYDLEQSEAITPIEEAAREKNLFAITLLGEKRAGAETLSQLVKDEDLNVRINAGLALLLMSDSRCLPALEEILIRDERDMGFARSHSEGKALGAWKAVASASARTKTLPQILSSTMTLKQKALRVALELPQEDFLQLATKLFERGQHPLVPLLVELLRNHHTPESIALLKEWQTRAGAPLIRGYCTLALYKMQESGPYEEQLITLVRSQEMEQIIRFREENDSETTLAYTLTPEEASQLLIDAFETLASSHNPAGIEALVHAIAYGNPKNKYALAGLLIRTAE